MRMMTWGEVAHTLRALRDEGPMKDSSGICWNFECYAVDLYGEDILDMEPMTIMFILMGVDNHYPVPHPTFTPEDAYSREPKPWSRDTEYGRNRWAFLDQLITFAEAQPSEKELPRDIC